MAKIREIISAIEQFAPLHLQESYDNAGLQVGDADAQTTGAVLCVDVTEPIIDEAISLGVNLVISHHPLIFRGLKKITGRNAIERIVLKAVKNDIAIYSAHTNLDSTRFGVSYRMAQKLGVGNVKVLSPQMGKLVEIVAFVPESHADAVAKAMHANGAGNIGDYECCDYRMQGEGSFLPKDGANPYAGTVGEVCHEKEIRIEVIANIADKDAIIEALIAAHPYEEAAYEVIPLLNASGYEGIGVVGDITPMPAMQFLKLLKATFDVDGIKYCGDEGKTISRVALCGGSGAEFVGDAIGAGADVYVTADVKYHEFTGNSERILIADIGHYESEQCTKEIFCEIIQKKMPNFALYYAKSENKQVKLFI